MMDDTGLNSPESMETLLAQQKRLMVGKRPAQMFPRGTPELPLPYGMARVENSRGVFHYNPKTLTAARVNELSASARENEILELGPYSKQDIHQRVVSRDGLTAVSEFTPEGIEVRTAAASRGTVAEQRAYFENTKDDGNSIIVGIPSRARRV